MIICVTGPMAAGKNFVCSSFAKQGWICIDADEQVHRAIKMSEPQIISAFEKEAKNADIPLKNADGSLNRKNLGALIFPHPELLKKQENIVFPLITEDTKKIIAENPDKNIILNATVMYKIPELLKICEKIVFVTAPLFIRFLRAKKRDNLSALQILQRFWAQRGLKKKYKEYGIPFETIKNW